MGEKIFSLLFVAFLFGVLLCLLQMSLENKCEGDCLRHGLSQFDRACEAACRWEW